MSDRKAVIKNADMGEEMQQDAVDCATQALEKYNIEKRRPTNDLRQEYPLQYKSHGEKYKDYNHMIITPKSM
ncbi:hypothetical protein PVAND_011821 [Polypedilum vanderplanki]|uniref:Dynein light chain n=1 Tax=Polypedilum vanderplanki TaxID=319348 RepID=A0A9J6CLJ6_POLVA|nr:hypothetical protein PVAND_011821 [Polypedilum vanderplanki]